MKNLATKLYSVWNCMKYRCHNKSEKNQYARWYRDRGIEVCKEWRSDFKEFEKWALLHGYEEGLTIDRIDPDGNYCPENCRWVTRSENSKHARAACSVTVNKSRGDDITAIKRGSSTITDDQMDAMEQFCIILRDADQKTKNKMLCFCEGFVAMNNFTTK